MLDEAIGRFERNFDSRENFKLTVFELTVCDL